MTTITVLGGERTIGGTQIVVEDGGHRLLFDCGIAYDPAGDPFAHVLHRPGRTLADLAALGLVSVIPGLYRPEMLPESSPAAAGPIAVAVSHAHLDHTHLLGFVDPRVPIYATPATARIVDVFSQLGITAAPIDRPIQEVDPGTPFEVGPIRASFVPVDHDVCGASGMLIETRDGTIAYSGDLRLHGSDPMRTLSFAAEARAAGANVLILEGTRLFPAPEPDSPTPTLRERVEADVVSDILRVLRAAPSTLGIILQSPENGDRVESLARALEETGRLYVMDLEGLALAYAALGRPIDAPHGVYVPSAWRAVRETSESLPPVLQKVLDDASLQVDAEQLRAAPGAYLLRIAFPLFADLLSIVRDGGLLFLSNGSPLGRFDPAFAHMEWWAERLRLQIVDAACTGHATPRDLALIAAQTGAPVVMSLHSRFPELMPVPAERLLLPERGRPYDLAELRAR